MQRPTRERINEEVDKAFDGAKAIKLRGKEKEDNEINHPLPFLPYFLEFRREEETDETASRLSPIRVSRYACSSAPSGIALKGRPFAPFGEFGKVGIGGRVGEG